MTPRASLQKGPQDMNGYSTPRYVNKIGKNAYTLAHGGSQLSRILLFNDDGYTPISPSDANVISPDGRPAAHLSFAKPP